MDEPQRRPLHTGAEVDAGQKQIQARKLKAPQDETSAG
jgi:hypothetical protein